MIKRQRTLPDTATRSVRSRKPLSVSSHTPLPSLLPRRSRAYQEHLARIPASLVALSVLLATAMILYWCSCAWCCGAHARKPSPPHAAVPRDDPEEAGSNSDSHGDGEREGSEVGEEDNPARARTEQRRVRRSLLASAPAPVTLTSSWVPTASVLLLVALSELALGATGSPTSTAACTTSAAHSASWTASSAT